MIQVEPEEFNQFVKERNAIPDGFKGMGGSIQTKWYVGDQEVARYTVDGFGEVYEIEEGSEDQEVKS